MLALSKMTTVSKAGMANNAGKGKTALKFRYITHIDTSHPKQEWNYALEQRMLALHNELGNKWAVIGHRMGGMY